MKLLLTSGGVTNVSIRDALVDRAELLGVGRPERGRGEEEDE